MTRPGWQLAQARACAPSGTPVCRLARSPADPAVSMTAAEDRKWRSPEPPRGLAPSTNRRKRIPRQRQRFALPRSRPRVLAMLRPELSPPRLTSGALVAQLRRAYDRIDAGEPPATVAEDFERES